jgi:hypothetical protein
MSEAALQGAHVLLLDERLPALREALRPHRIEGATGEGAQHRPECEWLGRFGTGGLAMLRLLQVIDTALPLGRFANNWP